MTASTYILNVAPERRDLLKQAAHEYGPGMPYPAEPVPRFAHSRKAPLLVLLSFAEGQITHIANGRKGVSAGTGLVRLNVEELTELKKPVGYGKLAQALPNRFQRYFESVASTGGILPPKTMQAVVDALQQIDPSISQHLSRFSAVRALRIAALSKKVKTNLAIEKEALTVVLEVAGVGSREILEWNPGENVPNNFLEGLPQTRAREDAMLLADFSNLPGFDAFGDVSHFATRDFIKSDDPKVRVTVFMANRLGLEEQSGTDLIYYNHVYKSFVLVQYKAFEKVGDRHEFRWSEKDKFTDELQRMENVLSELAKLPVETDPDGFRLTSNPFFLKFCSRTVFDPDNRGLFPGFYIPHGLWNALTTSNRLKGAQGGNLLTYENAGRRLSNPEFIQLVSGCWVGTTINQSSLLSAVIRRSLETGRGVTFAVKRKPEDPGGAGMSAVNPINLDGAEARQPLQQQTLSVRI